MKFVLLFSILSLSACASIPPVVGNISRPVVTLMPKDNDRDAADPVNRQSNVKTYTVYTF